MDKKNNEIEPDKAIKYLPIFYTVVILFFVLIALASHNLIEKPENDLFNVTTLVLEVMFGILITWTVYIYSKKMEKRK